MSWLRNLFRPGEARPPAPRHIGILVRGTLFNAQMAVSQLTMQGISASPGLNGVAALFGIDGELRAEHQQGQWVVPRSLKPPWLFVIPEDSFEAFGRDFGRDVGRPIDGRIAEDDPFSFVNINGAAIQEVSRILESWGPAPPPGGTD
jgi:hypothetical protein